MVAAPFIFGYSSVSPITYPRSLYCPSATALRKAQVTILGYANVYRVPYRMLYLLMFSLEYLCTLLPGQVKPGLASVALTAHSEALGGTKDMKGTERVVGKALNSSQISIADTRFSTAAATSPKTSCRQRFHEQGCRSRGDGNGAHHVPHDYTPSNPPLLHFLRHRL